MQPWSWWTLFCIAVGFSLRILYENIYKKNSAYIKADIDPLLGDISDKRLKEREFNIEKNGYLEPVHFRILDLKTGEMYYPNEIGKYTFNYGTDYVSDVQVVLKNGKVIQSEFLPTEGCKLYDKYGREFFVGDYVKYQGKIYAVNRNWFGKPYIVNENEKMDLDEASVGAMIVGNAFDRRLNELCDTTCLNMVGSCNEMLKTTLYTLTYIKKNSERKVNEALKEQDNKNE